MGLDALGWILLGVAVGVAGRFIWPRRDPDTIVVSVLLGIAGALLAGYMGLIAGLYPMGARAGYGVALLGSALAIGLYRLFTRRP